MVGVSNGMLGAIVGEALADAGAAVLGASSVGAAVKTVGPLEGTPNGAV